MPENKLYFVYYAFNGAVCMGKVVGEHTIDGRPAQYLAKYEITEEEFKGDWETLRRKFPIEE